MVAISTCSNGLPFTSTLAGVMDSWWIHGFLDNETQHKQSAGARLAACVEEVEWPGLGRLRRLLRLCRALYVDRDLRQPSSCCARETFLASSAGLHCRRQAPSYASVLA